MNRLEVLNPHENYGILEPTSYSEVGFSGEVIIPGQRFIIGALVSW
jgi:hypothetical protein